MDISSSECSRGLHDLPGQGPSSSCEGHLSGGFPCARVTGSDKGVNLLTGETQKQGGRAVSKGWVGIQKSVMLEQGYWWAYRPHCAWHMRCAACRGLLLAWTSGQARIGGNRGGRVHRRKPFCSPAETRQICGLMLASMCAYPKIPNTSHTHLSSEAHLSAPCTCAACTSCTAAASSVR